MLGWAIFFLVIALIAGVLGFTGIAGALAMIAKLLFILFLVVFVVMLIAGRRRRPIAPARWRIAARPIAPTLPT